MATYDYLKSKNGHKIQVESAKRDGAGKNIENNYAKQNGYYAQLTAGLADNLTPYSEDSGDFQENPFISNGTGTNNNQEIVTVGDYALVEQKQGNTVGVNQLVGDPTMINANYWNGSRYTPTVSDNVLTMECTDASGGYGNIYGVNKYKVIKDHKYLLNVYGKCDTCYIGFGGLGSQYGNRAVSSDDFTHIFEVVTATNNSTTLYPFGTQGSGLVVGAKSYLKDFYLTDLTQMFNNDQTIIDDITANPSHFFWYYNGSLAYNTGSLESANGRYLVSTGRNLWDEQWELGNINDTTGAKEDTTAKVIRSVNYTKVIPNKTYYILGSATNYGGIYIYYYDVNKNFIGRATYNSAYNVRNQIITTPSNCVYIMLKAQNTISVDRKYYNDITISLYYTPEQGGEGYNKYYQYEEPTIVDTGTEPLLSAGNAYDYKTKDGVIHRIVGEIDLGDLTYSYTAPNETYPYGFFTATGTQTAIRKSNNSNIKCAKYVNNRNAPAFTHDKNILTTSGTGFYIIDSAYSDATTIKSALSGVKVYVELATPTTEQGTPFAENLPINDYGMLYWLDTNNELVGIPQGVKIFFPVNYKGLVDDVYSRTSGDAGNLVIQSEFQESETERDTVDTQLKNAIGGTLRQCLCVKESLDFDNTNVIDLGVQDWATYGSYTNFDRYISNAINSAPNNAKAICSKYKTITTFTDSLENANSVYIGTGNGKLSILVAKNTYATADDFKAAMKGVLLAYEKA